MSLAGVDILDEEKLSECDLVNLDSENIVKVSVALLVVVLLLNADLTIVVELTSK